MPPGTGASSDCVRHQGSLGTSASPNQIGAASSNPPQIARSQTYEGNGAKATATQRTRMITIHVTITYSKVDSAAATIGLGPATYGR